MSTIIIITPPPKKPPTSTERRIELPDDLSVAEQLRAAADILEGKT